MDTQIEKIMGVKNNWIWSTTIYSWIREITDAFVERFKTICNSVQCHSVDAKQLSLISEDAAELGVLILH